MKTKFNKYALVLLGLLIVVSCGKDFLETSPKGSQLENSFYHNADDAYAGLVAVYDVCGWMSGGYITKVGSVNSASDDHYAGGGGATDINSFQVWDNFTLTPTVGPQGDLWTKGFQGIFRANVLLGKLPAIPMDEALKTRFTAETTLLRAYFYFDLIRFFKNVPLLTKPVSANDMYQVVQAAPGDVYKQIEDDIKAAIPNLPATVTGGESARVTSGFGHALLGKVYLYEQKYAEAAAELAQVNGTTPGGTTEIYGYKLLSNFGDLFIKSNKFNSESIFEISFTSTSNSGWSQVGSTEGNILNTMCNPRTFTRLPAGTTAGVPDYFSGWSFFTITPSLVAAMTGDPRYQYTIADIKGMQTQGYVTYIPGYHDTGYFLKKFMSTKADISTGGGVAELNFPQDIYEIRLADTYLMEAEALVRAGGNAARAQQLLDAVRARVTLPSIPATVDNILLERRLELAGEGHRWFDLVRTGTASAALASEGFITGKHEYLPIPVLELNNTKIEQSVEWGGTK